ncbi:PEP-CTERM sorting domain-containing protein [Rhodopirellula sp. SWK7]|uniref:PEP-CTERM sorting domain-containing protein n=1 Tax=Rhodopirellula sp. SWK7 TaxID=595460 RepID=UPI0002BD7DAF|nr:PEP-CTERM sorting domain-containing protein [Rhodopirellula sp. SWK7]EMI42521.1 secreted protein containing PEP-CTERM bacterial domain protein [Rhodopirellula sp. SWK7]
MKKFVFSMVATLVALVSAPAHADLLITGTTTEFVGPGSYQLEWLATSVGGDSIAGFNLSTDFSGVGGAATSWVQHPDFELQAFVNADPTNTGFGGTSIFGSDLVISDGQTVSLGTFTFNATQAGVIDQIQPSAFFSSEAGFPAIPTTYGGTGTPALTAPTAVPEPSSLAALGVLGLVSGAIRRRRKAAKA